MIRIENLILKDAVTEMASMDGRSGRNKDGKGYIYVQFRWLCSYYIRFILEWLAQCHSRNARKATS